MKSKNKHFLSLQLSEELKDGELSRLASKITPEHLTTIAINYLGFTQVDTDNLKSATRHDVEDFKRRILIEWRKRAAPEGRKVRRFSVSMSLKINTILSLSVIGSKRKSLKFHFS